MKEIPVLERFAAQSLVESDGELIFSKEKFAELIVRECLTIVERKEYSYHEADPLWETAQLIKQHFGVDQ